MEFVTRLRTPELARSPTVVAAFHGWNDAGGAATLAAGYLKAATSAETFATIDGDPFIDYQQTRPTVRLVDGEVRRIDWPDTDVSASDEHALVVVLGTEPNMRWRGFSGAVAGIARELGSDIVITLGALLADTPHTRPVPVSATASDTEMMSRHGLTRSTYEGPTGIVGVLHEACQREGLRSASLWAATPHYISASPNPRAACALLDRLAGIVGTPGPSPELRRAATRSIVNSGRPRPPAPAPRRSWSASWRAVERDATDLVTTLDADLADLKRRRAAAAAEAERHRLARKTAERDLAAARRRYGAAEAASEAVAADRDGRPGR